MSFSLKFQALKDLPIFNNWWNLLNQSGDEIHPKSREDNFHVFSWNAIMRGRIFYFLRSRTLWTYFINQLFLPSELRQFHLPFCFVFSEVESSKYSNCSHYHLLHVKLSLSPTYCSSSFTSHLLSIYNLLFIPFYTQTFQP